MAQIFEYVKMALSNIRANKVRSFLTMLGIIIGISSVILVLAIGNGAKNVITDALSGIGAGQIALSTTDDTGTYNITSDDIDAIRSQISGIKGISVQTSGTGTTQTKKGEFTVNSTGVMQEYEYFSNKGLLKGRYFNEKEYDASQPVCVIGQDDAIRLFGSTDVIGMELDITIEGSELSYTIVGVEKPASSSLMNFVYGNSPVNIVVPYTVFQNIYDNFSTTSFSQLYVLADKNANTYDIASNMQKLVERRHHAQGNQDDIYQIENFSDYMTIANTVTNMVTAIISLVAAISLIVGGIGVMNIMLVSVTERTREIGIRKSLGAKTKSIMLQFLSESAIITLIGGAIGILLGIASAYMVSGIVGIVNPSLKFTPDVSLSAVLIATLFSCGIGIFFGIYPAKKAAKLSPIEALRRN